ncbi:MAG: ComEC/Rec2 family competence protein [Micrococcaceae bacterium]
MCLVITHSIGTFERRTITELPKVEVNVELKLLGDIKVNKEQFVKTKIKAINNEIKNIEAFLTVNKNNSDTYFYHQTLLAEVQLTKAKEGNAYFIKLKSKPQIVADTPEWLKNIQKGRHNFVEVISTGNETTKLLLPGFLYGDTSEHSKELKEQFKTAGITHITAVSGANCALVLLISAKLFQLYRFPVAFRRAVQLVVLTLFLILVRFEASAMCAGLMAGLALLWTIFDKKVNFQHTIACTILLILVIDPWMSLNYGFLLSVAASMAIVISGPPCIELFQKHLGKKFATVLAIPVVTQLWCLPITVLLQEGIPFYSVLANILVLPTVTIVSLLAYVLFIFPFLKLGILPISDVLTNYIIWVAQLPQKLPLTKLIFPQGYYGLFLVLGVYLLTYFLIKHTIPLRKTIIVLSLFTWFTTQLTIDKYLFNIRTLEPGDIVQCDVGQGDGYLIASYDNHVMMIDAGPDDNIRKCLRQFKVKEVDLLVITHLHEDHFEGYETVLATTKVHEVFLPKNGLEDKIEAEITKNLDTQNIPIKHVQKGMSGETQNVQWQVLWPDKKPIDDELNNTSIVLSTRIYTKDSDYTALFLGDSEKEVHQKIYNKVRHHDVLKVGHHGSKTSDPALFRKVKPQVALISCGKGNKYGHPHQNTLEVLEELKAKIMRSDKEGSAVLDFAVSLEK